MRKLLLLLLSTALLQTAFSQIDSLYYANLIEGRTPTDASMPIFNGRQHIGYPSSMEGIAYYASNEWQKGTLVFEDILYKDVFLKYDLVADEVVIRHLNGFTGVILFTPRIASFTLGDKQFVNLAPNEQSSFKGGIYEELATGKITLYAKRSKIIDEKIVANAIVKSILDKNSFYVFKDGRYYQIKNQKSIMALIPDKKKEVNASLRASRIKYRKNRELALTKIVTYYNQLSH